MPAIQTYLQTFSLSNALFSTHFYDHFQYKLEWWYKFYWIKMLFSHFSNYCLCRCTTFPWFVVQEYFTNDVLLMYRCSIVLNWCKIPWKTLQNFIWKFDSGHLQSSVWRFNQFLCQDSVDSLSNAADGQALSSNCWAVTGQGCNMASLCSSSNQQYFWWTDVNLNTVGNKYKSWPRNMMLYTSWWELRSCLQVNKWKYSQAHTWPLFTMPTATNTHTFGSWPPFIKIKK